MEQGDRSSARPVGARTRPASASARRAGCRWSTRPEPRATPAERQRRARKIKPQYAEGELVKVARAKNQPEAEFIAGLLLEEGIPCLLRNSIGGYSPMIGPREVMVPESGAEAAREALAW